MNVLQIPLSAFPDEGITVDAEVPGADVQPQGAADLPMESICITGALTGDGEEFVFNGRMTGAYLGNCDRCLGPAKVPFAMKVLWVFAEGPPRHPFEEPEDKDSEELTGDGVIRTSFDGNILDLAPAVWEEAVLGAPLKLLCSDNCAGLCHECGANWNESRCNCAASEDDTSFADTGLKGLKVLFPDVNTDRMEE